MMIIDMDVEQPTIIKCSQVIEAWEDGLLDLWNVAFVVLLFRSCVAFGVFLFVCCFWYVALSQRFAMFPFVICNRIWITKYN